VLTKKLVGVCVALFMSACGVDVIDKPEATSSTEQAILFACDGSTIWTRYWYQSGVEVGREDCDCNGIVTPHGVLSGQYTQVVGPSCGGGGGGGGGGGDGCFTGDKPGEASSSFVAPTC
jgi:hypothetical protein